MVNLVSDILNRLWEQKNLVEMFRTQTLLLGRGSEARAEDVKLSMTSTDKIVF